jgi:hypothetical protein
MEANRTALEREVTNHPSYDPHLHLYCREYVEHFCNEYTSWRNRIYHFEA